MSPVRTPAYAKVQFEIFYATRGGKLTGTMSKTPIIFEVEDVVEGRGGILCRFNSRKAGAIYLIARDTMTL